MGKHRAWAIFPQGMLVFARLLAPSGPSRLLLCRPLLCSEANCDCRDVSLAAIDFDLDTDFSQLDAMSDQVTAMLTSPQAMNAVLDLDVGSVSPDDFQGRVPLSSEWLEYVQSQVDGELLDELHDRWLQSKGLRRRAPDEIDWPALEPGALLGWSEVEPDGRQDLYLDGDDVFAVEELYCVNPDCDCADVTLDVAELVAPRSARSIGYVRVRLPEVDVVEREGPSGRITRLWAAYQARYPAAGVRLLERMRRVSALARARLGDARPRTPVIAPKRVGRNEPCPCGSGKKYKRCCGP